jgi:small subunit ribosomal protein S9
MVAVKRDKLTGDAIGTGRRKTAVARVRLRVGTGKITVNDRALEDFFPSEEHRNSVFQVLDVVNRRGSFDVMIRVKGGGSAGQAGASRMGIARALVSYDSQLYSALRQGGFLTRDARMKERKKYGLHGARRGTQFSKR